MDSTYIGWFSACWSEFHALATIIPVTSFVRKLNLLYLENSLHYRRDVTLLEDRTRLKDKNAAQVMACINNLVLRILAQQPRFQFVPAARRFFDAHPAQGISLITRL